nr:uncharacterized protein LOC123493968 [Aegilops tauschii subsp. strangulata]
MAAMDVRFSNTWQPSRSSKSSTGSRTVRGPAKKLKDGVKYNIDAIKPNGEPREPKKNADKLVRQCGVLVKDQIPISMQEWKKPAKERPDLTWVDQRAKDLLWETLMSHFTLPDHFIDADVQKVKDAALRKMAVAFNNHKKSIWAKYVEGGKKTLEFTGTLEKQREHWPAFMKFKKSELAKERSRVNKLNAVKKEHFHRLGPELFQLFKDRESIVDFGLRLSALVADLELYSDPVTEHKAVQKFLRVVPRRYRTMAMAIESLIDLKTMSIEELVGRLSACEDHYDLDDGSQSTGRLLLTHEEWLAREKLGGGGGSSTGGGGGGGKNKSPAKPKSQGGGKGALGNAGAGGSCRSCGKKKKGKCHHCGIPGHWKKECRTWLRKQEQKGKPEQANLAQADAEHDHGLYMAVVTTIDTSHLVAPQEVYLNEEKVMPVPSPNGVWFFDAGASSHMTGDGRVFLALDETVRGTVRFGDGFVVAMHGRGSVVFRCQSGGQRALTGVFFISSLRTNIVSVGQLDEAGCIIDIRDSVIAIHDPSRRVLACIKRSTNRLYSGALAVDALTCLMAIGDDEAWRWHTRMGHLHFRALRAMATKEMVRGMPVIDRVEEYCDGCALGKQHRAPFR